MSTPQQPELRRSGNIPAFEPDAIAAEQDAEKTTGGHGAGSSEKRNDVQQPPFGDARSSSATEDQDKPDLDEFADVFGVASDADSTS